MSIFFNISKLRKFRFSITKAYNFSTSNLLCLNPASISKFKSDDVSKGSDFWTVVSYSTAEQYDLAKLATALFKQGLYIPSDLTSNEPLASVPFGSVAIHAVAKYKLTPENRHIYFYREGNVVIWNCSNIEARSIVNFLRPFEIRKYEDNLVTSEVEKMKYAYCTTSKKTNIHDGVMRLSLINKTLEDVGPDRYTVSNAMACSVKLGVLESLLDEFGHNIAPVMEDLKLGRPVKISKSGVLRKSGELFSMRHSINLSSELLDIPDFYWERENLEGLYESCCSYFSISKRTKVINEKLTHCVELLNLLSTHLSDRHHIRLEWMIIILIMVEVAFEVLHFL